MINLTRQQARKIDHLAMTELGIPSIVLMENAGLNAVAAINRFMADQYRDLTRALIFCGGGNNAGDGYVIARHLHNQGCHIQIIATKPIDQLIGDAAINATICKNMGLNIQPAPDLPNPVFPNSSDSFPPPISSVSSPPDLIIDALLGTGFQGNLRPDMLHLIQAINAIRSADRAPTVIAIDLPSGLDCDTGKSAQDAIHADLTITFVAPKLGFTNPAAKPYLGQVEVADIGVPPGLIDRLRN